MTPGLYEYAGETYPDYLKGGNAMQFIAATAAHFCKGKGVDVGCGKWPLEGAVPVDQNGRDEYGAMNLPGTDGEYDYVFSSHCLEHLVNPVRAIEHWKARLRSGGCLFLYLPHPDMRYWRPQHCRKHLHVFHPTDVAGMLRDLGFIDVIHGHRDLAWSFATVGYKA